jgi:hypothetical protein
MLPCWSPLASTLTSFTSTMTRSVSRLSQCLCAPPPGSAAGPRGAPREASRTSRGLVKQHRAVLVEHARGLAALVDDRAELAGEAGRFRREQVPVRASGGDATARARRPRTVPRRHRPHPGRHHNSPIAVPLRQRCSPTACLLKDTPHNQSQPGRSRRRTEAPTGSWKALIRGMPTHLAHGCDSHPWPKQAGQGWLRQRAPDFAIKPARASTPLTPRTSITAGDERHTQMPGLLSRRLLALQSPEASAWLAFPASRSHSGILSPPRRSCSEVLSQPLRPGLADVQPSTDRAARRNAIRCQLTGEYLGRLLLERVRKGHATGRALRCPGREVSIPARHVQPRSDVATCPVPFDTTATFAARLAASRVPPAADTRYSGSRQLRQGLAASSVYSPGA